NYPNPFNAQTTIRFSLQKPEYVKLSVYNLAGQLVETLVNSYRSSGENAIEWDASNYSSGIYFYSLKTDEKICTKRMLLIK
ncbi:MAG: T9SS type A sorting domain-containing protein, partial [candidate division Zixibacteria bacterium]|nr:T9SS type A sorting domain-containing protein [candidate division Zixibacteria bacterium]